MKQKSEKIVNKAIEDPEKLYKNPESVLGDRRLTRADKDAILRSWEQDQLAILRAEEENMTQKSAAPPALYLLEKIKKAEKDLEGPWHAH